MNGELIKKRGVGLLAIIGSFFIVDTVLGWGSEPEPEKKAAPKQAQPAPVWQVIGGTRGWKGVPVERPSQYQPKQPQSAPYFPQELDETGVNPWSVKRRPVESQQPKQSRPWGELPPTPKSDWRDEKRTERSVPERSQPRVMQNYNPAPSWGYANRGYSNPGYAMQYPYSGNSWETGNPFSNGMWSPWSGSGNSFPWGNGNGDWPFMGF